MLCQRSPPSALLSATLIALQGFATHNRRIDIATLCAARGRRTCAQSFPALHSEECKGKVQDLPIDAINAIDAIGFALSILLTWSMTSPVLSAVLTGLIGKTQIPDYVPPATLTPYALQSAPAREGSFANQLC